VVVEALCDLLLHILEQPDLKVAVVLVDIVEPELEKVVPETVASQFAFERVFLRYGNLFVYESQIDELFNIACKLGALHFQHTGDLSQFGRPFADGFKNGKVGGDFIDLLFQQEIAFTVEKSVFIEDKVSYILFETTLLSVHLQVFGYCPECCKDLHELFGSEPWNEVVNVSGEHRLEMDDTGTPAMKRCRVVEDLRMHHGDGRTAEDQVDVTLFQMQVPHLLQHRGEALVQFRQILVLIDDQNQFLFTNNIVGEVHQCIFKTLKSDIPKL